MSWSRREFLGGVAGCGAAGMAGAFPRPPRPWALPHWWHQPGDKHPVLPVGALQRLGSQRFLDADYVSHLEFDPAGKQIFSVNTHGIRSWNVATGLPALFIPYRMKWHSFYYRVTTHETILVIDKSSDMSLELVTLPISGKAPASRAESQINLKILRKIMCTRDGHWVVLLSNDRTLRVLDAASGEVVWSQSFQFASRGVNDVALVDGYRLLAITFHSVVQLLDIETGKTVDLFRPTNLHAHTNPNQLVLQGLTGSGDGRRLAGLRYDQNELLVWSIPAGTYRSYKLNVAANYQVSGFSSDCDSILLMSYDGELLNLDLSTGEVVQRIDVGPGTNYWNSRLSPDGKLLATGFSSTILLLDTTTGRLAPSSGSPPDIIRRLQFHGPNRLSGQLQNYGGWTLFDLESETSQLIRPPSVNNRLPIGCTSCLEWTVYSSNSGFQLWNPMDGSNKTINHPNARDLDVIALGAVDRVLVAHSKDNIHYWRLPDGESGAIPCILPRDDYYKRIAVSADGTIVAASTNERIKVLGFNRIMVYSLDLKRQLCGFTLDQVIWRMQLSPKGNLLAAMCNAKTRNEREYHKYMLVFDIRSRSVISTFRIHDVMYIEFAFSPDERLLAIPSRGNSLHIWEIASGSVRLEYQLPGNGSAVAFSPDSARVAVACGGGPVIIWDARGKHLAPTIPPSPERWSTFIKRLAEPDSATALTALQEAAAWPEEALPLMAEAVKPVPNPDLEKIRGFIDKLGAPAFAERDHAMQQLLEIGDTALPEVRKVIAKTASEEVRNRAETILRQSSTGNHAALLPLRVVEAAEWIGNAKARAWLAELAAGAEGATLTHEARAALERLA